MGKRNNIKETIYYYTELRLLARTLKSWRLSGGAEKHKHLMSIKVIVAKEV